MTYIIAHYRKEINDEFNPQNKKSFGDYTYEKSLNWLKASVKKNTNSKLIILTDYETKISGFSESELIRIDTKKLNLMTAIIKSEEYAVKKFNNEKIIFCGPDEIFLQDPEYIFNDDFDIKLPLIKYGRIINGVVFVRSNVNSQKFYTMRSEYISKIEDRHLNWGADMVTYERIIELFSCKIKFLLVFSEYKINKGTLFLKIYRFIAHYLILYLKFNTQRKMHDKRKIKFNFYEWDNKIGGSVPINGSDINIKNFINKKINWLFIDFKGRDRKQIMSKYVDYLNE